MPRFASRRQGPRMDRIKKIVPVYVKAIVVAMTVCLSVVMFTLWFDAPDEVDGPRLGRALLAKEKCDGDVVLPIFPSENEWNVPLRAILYLVGLGYLFLGVAISADTFMAAIEVITSKTNTIYIGGEEVEVEVWNSTVANLTLMALGSSAPEILLAVVETVSLTFQAGDLGPGTIVGSAAFNLLFITAICISALPEKADNPDEYENRMIEEFGVFMITAVASLWAYFWMVLVLAWSSTDVINIFEALATFFMFPVLVALSYGQDVGWWGMFGSDSVHPEGESTSSQGEIKSWTITGEDGKKRRATIAGNAAAAIATSENSESDVTVDPQAAARKAAQDAMRKKKKSRLEYRIQATRKMTGGKRVLPSAKDAAAAMETVAEELPGNTIELGFALSAHEFPEGVGTCQIKVIRSGITDQPCTVQFDTSDGDAISGTDYVSAQGVLEFSANETEKDVPLTIIDDNEWAPDKKFYVRLYEAKASTEGVDMIFAIATAQITILNDDDPGLVSFDTKTFSAIDTKEQVVLKLVRSNGQDGNVLAFLRTVDGTAKNGVDFVGLSEDFEVHFQDKVREMEIPIDLIKNSKNANSTFGVEITSVEPEGAKVGDINVCTVIITDDKNYKELMENVVAMMDDEMGKYGVGTSSWTEQLHDAMNMGGDDGDPEAMDYLMHFLSFYWKVVHAIVPPTDYGGGWYTFCVSLCFIGIITCLVGDMAKMLGCVMGLDDSITAITFVALGTSLPDTFASVEATISDDTADAAITNVTGSNSVNVFLGLGLPWTMAAIYHLVKGTTYVYPSGDLVFSVLVFFVFAVICIALLLFRRWKFEGELGGNKMCCHVSSAFLGFLWFTYIVISALKTKKHI